MQYLTYFFIENIEFIFHFICNSTVSRFSKSILRTKAMQKCAHSQYQYDHHIPEPGGVFFVCNTWCGDIEPENLAIATHINWETYVSKRLISSNKEFLTKPSIYESYGSVY